jgi:hypothetical protein
MKEQKFCVRAHFSSQTIPNKMSNQYGAEKVVGYCFDDLGTAEAYKLGVLTAIGSRDYVEVKKYGNDIYMGIHPHFDLDENFNKEDVIWSV